MIQFKWKVETSCHLTLMLLLIAFCLTACGGGGSSSGTGLDSGAGNDEPLSALEWAIQTGDASEVADASTFLDATLVTIDANQGRYNDARIQLFNLAADGTARSDGGSLTAISWDPTHDAALLDATYGVNEGILIGNETASDRGVRDKPFAVVGEYRETDSATPYLVMGGNPMRNADGGRVVNEQMHRFLQNSVEWLTGRDNFDSAPLNVVIAHMAQSYYFPDQQATRRWFDSFYAGKVFYNAAGSCDNAALPGCITAETDLLVISKDLSTGEDSEQVVLAVKGALETGVPVLYLHHDGNNNELSTRLFGLLDVRYEEDNYSRKQLLTDYNPLDHYAALPGAVQQVKDLLIALRDDSFTFDLAECNDHLCPPGSAYYPEFDAAVGIIHDMMKEFDAGKNRIFDSEKYRYEKLLLLLGDKYRESVVLPMDKNSTPRIDFLKGLYADHANMIYRDINPAQGSLGRFGRSDFSHVVAVDKTIRMTSKKQFRAAGVYALPGQTLTVTRHDDSAVSTALFLNTLRPGSTHEFNTEGNTYGYNAPKILRTRAVPVKPGETIRITSSHGGPVQVAFDANDETVDLTFRNVGEHPFWKGPENDHEFTARMMADDYDWGEIVTEGFEVHSQIDKLRQSITAWGNAAALANATNRYIGNFPYVLAGLQGPRVDSEPEIFDFAASNGWSLDTIDIVQHMNADQGDCGYGCSGNPYDAYWAFSPLFHGDIHELGHNLENSRFKFNGFERHATTNFYSYYTKSRYYRDSGNHPDCQNLPFETLFNMLQQSRNEADPFAYVQAQGLENWNQAYVIMTQIMMRAQKDGVLRDGWHLIGRLHVLQRNFDRAGNSDGEWEEAKTNLGFDMFSRQDAAALDNSSWLLVALSRLTERDLRDYFTMWGLDYSAQAAAQVASFAHAPAPLEFFLSGPTEYCETFDIPTLPVDGTQVWP